MNWKPKSLHNTAAVHTLMTQLNVSKLIATLLVHRGITNFEEAKQFFRPQLEELHNPFLMKDMQKAVDRICQAIQHQEKILIYGDYDVDGTTAVALLSTFLKKITPHIYTYIPDRYTEGYGVSDQGIDYAAQHQITLIISLDCGIKSADKVDYAATKKIDFIICDHHLPDKNLPRAIAILDPKQPHCTYPYKELCGCAVGFKLIQALAITLNIPFEQLYQYLDLVAVATIADIVPITGENRILVHYGLKLINQQDEYQNMPKRKGLHLTLEHNIKELKANDILFKIAPKINAAGRIKSGNYAVKLLSENNDQEVQKTAQDIIEFNHIRKELDHQITQEALQIIEANHEQNNYTSVVYNPHWHPTAKGVIGIVASRLIETYYKPTIVLVKTETEDGKTKLAASARSVKGFDLYQALDKCKEHLIQFGGHIAAAGFTLYEENYPAFKQAFEQVVKNTITPNQRYETLEIDAEIDFSELDPKTLRILKQFEPHGPENLPPIFVTQNTFTNQYPQTVGKDHSHLRLHIAQATPTHISPTYTAVGFGLGHFAQTISPNHPIKVAYTLIENEWNGTKTTQLSIRDIKF